MFVFIVKEWENSFMELDVRVNTITQVVSAEADPAELRKETEKANRVIAAYQLLGFETVQQQFERYRDMTAEEREKDDQEEMQQTIKLHSLLEGILD